MGNLTYSKGISWIDDCRIPFVSDEDGYTDEEWKNLYAGDRKESNTNIGNEIKNIVRELLPKAPQGRFPANILVSDDMLNDGKIYKSGEVKLHHKRNKTLGEYQGNAYGKFNNINSELNYENYYGDKGTNSRYYDIDKWFEKLLDV